MKIEERLKLTKHKCRFKRGNRNNHEKIEDIRNQMRDYFKQKA